MVYRKSTGHTGAQMFDKEVSRSFQKAESGALARAAPTETLEQAWNHHTLA
jgi:hypothetical protein